MHTSMKMLDSLCFGLWLQIFFFSLFHSARCEQQVLGPQIRLRNATLEDVEDIITVIVEAFSDLPSWKYQYQFRKEFAEEHRRCARPYIIQAISWPSYQVEVIEAPANSNIGVVAVAIWSQINPQNQSHLGLMASKCTHRDLNLTRAIDFDHKFWIEKRKYIDEGFGSNQLYLANLGTHPDYQLRGAGTRLVNSGIERGRKEHWNVTLIAQPTAETFYLHLGFVSVANISIVPVDKELVFRFNVMAYDFDHEVF